MENESTVGMPVVVLAVTWRPVSPHDYEAEWGVYTLRVGGSALRGWLWTGWMDGALIASNEAPGRDEAMRRALVYVEHPRLTGEAVVA